MIKLASLLVLAAGLASASTITWVTSIGTENGGNAVSAQVDFTASAGQLLITLQNLQPGITTVAQNISDLEFMVSTGLVGTTTMTSSGQEISCLGSPCTPGVTAPTGWGLGTLGSTSIICIVCGDANLTINPSDTPSHTIVGPNPDNSHGSLNTAPHNPFISETATFTISNASITELSTISGVVFSFNTTAGDNVAGCAVGSPGCGGGSNAPEPLSMFLMGTGLIGFGVLGKFRHS